jgi:hypothetical protein
MNMDDSKKDPGEERLPYCTKAPSAEHARAHDKDEPCDDGRSGKAAPAKAPENEILCKSIRALYPEIGECGIDIHANWNKDKKIWIIDFKSGPHVLTTHLEPEDANACMEGRHCPPLGIKIADLKSNIIKAKDLPD